MINDLPETQKKICKLNLKILNVANQIIWVKLLYIDTKSYTIEYVTETRQNVNKLFDIK